MTLMITLLAIFVLVVLFLVEGPSSAPQRFG